MNERIARFGNRLFVANAMSVGMALACGVLLVAAQGCGTGGAQKQKKGDFFTSGSREADQRATQRMAKEEQLSDTSKGAGDNAGKENDKNSSAEGQGKAPAKKTLYERLGGQQGIAAIVEDFTPRVLEDPRVNWWRQGIKTGRIFNRSTPPSWKPTTNNVARIKIHVVQFLSLATGGPPQYDGKEMRSAHAEMRITNPEFDAVIGDLKASLDNLRVADREQKELLAIIESTRPQIVTER